MYVCTRICFSIHLFMAIWVASCFWPLQIKLQWAFRDGSVRGCIFLLLESTSDRMAGSNGRCMNKFLVTGSCFLKWLYHFIFPAVVYESPIFSMFLSTHDIVNFLNFSYFHLVYSISLGFLICICLITNDGKYPFLNLLVIHISMLQCLFKPFAHHFIDLFSCWIFGVLYIKNWI